MSDTQAGEIDEAVGAARKAIEGEDTTALRSALERVTNLSHQVAASLYQSAPTEESGQPGSDSSQEPSQGRGSDDVVDAEYTVKD